MNPPTIQPTTLLDAQELELLVRTLNTDALFFLLIGFNHFSTYHALKQTIETKYKTHRPKKPSYCYQ